MLATVEYQIATYSGTVSVTCEPDDDEEIIISKAKEQLRRKAGILPFGYQSWKILKKE